MLDYRKGRTAAPRAPAEFGKLGRPFRGFQIALFGIEAKQLDVARGDGLCQEQILKKARMPRHRHPLVIPARQLLDRIGTGIEVRRPGPAIRKQQTQLALEVLDKTHGRDVQTLLLPGFLCLADLRNPTVLQHGQDSQHGGHAEQNQKRCIWYSPWRPIFEFQKHPRFRLRL